MQFTIIILSYFAQRTASVRFITHSAFLTEEGRVITLPSVSVFFPFNF